MAAYIVEYTSREYRLYPDRQLGRLSYMKLAILLTSGFEAQDRRTVVRLAEAALGLGHQVSLFLMADGVYCAPFVAGLSTKGALVVWCGHNARQRGLPGVPNVHDGSQYDWACMVAEADRVLSFG